MWEAETLRTLTDCFGKMRRLAMFIMIGIAGMFLAPFGMLISKNNATIRDSIQVEFLDAFHELLVAHGIEIDSALRWNALAERLHHLGCDDFLIHDHASLKTMNPT